MAPQTPDTGDALDRAMHVFWVKGYAATSAEDLIAAMGVDPAELYDGYGSKGRLYECALERYLVRDRLRFAEGLGVDAPLEERLASMMRRYADLLATDPHGRGCFMVDACEELVHDDVIGPMLRAELLTQERLLTEEFRRARARGEAVADTPEESLAAYVVSAVQGLRLVGKTTRDRDRLERIIDLVLTTAFPRAAD